MKRYIKFKKYVKIDLYEGEKYSSRTIFSFRGSINAMWIEIETYKSTTLVQFGHIRRYLGGIWLKRPVRIVFNE